MRRRIEVWSIAAVVAVAAGILFASSASAAPDAGCRRAVGKGGRHYGIVIANQKILCHLRRMEGRLPVTIDCNDVATWSANGFGRGVTFVQAGANFLRERILRGCAAALPPIDLGYSTCPAPCNLVPINNTYDGVADCVQCLTEDSVGTLVTNAYGTPPVPQAHPVVRECQGEAGRSLRRYYNGRVKLQQLCQYKKDRGVGRFFNEECDLIDDPEHPYKARMDLLRARLGVTVQRACEFVNLTTELNSCGGDVENEIACLKGAVENSATVLFSIAYPNS